MIIPKKKGKVIITAKIGKKTYKFNLTIKMPVQNVILNKFELELQDKPVKLNARVTPSSADNKKLIWKTSDKT